MLINSIIFSNEIIYQYIKFYMHELGVWILNTPLKSEILATILLDKKKVLFINVCMTFNHWKTHECLLFIEPRLQNISLSSHICTHIHRTSPMEYLELSRIFLCLCTWQWNHISRCRYISFVFSYLCASQWNTLICHDFFQFIFNSIKTHEQFNSTP
jgi:hypothetical protein